MPERRFQYPEMLAARGLPAPDAATMAALVDIVDEGVLGASNHVALALPLVAKTARAERETALAEAQALAEFIAGTRGIAAPIVANALAWLTADVDRLEPDAAAERLAARAEAWDRHTRERRARLVSRAAETLAACRAPLLFDYSSTVADVVRALADGGRLRQLVIPESRSIDGGRRYVEALSDLRLPVLFLPDAALDYAVRQSDVVLLGAESVTRDGGVVNTIGSVIAARSAQLAGVPVYGAADLFKVGPLEAARMPAPEVRSYVFLLAGGMAAATEAPELEIVAPDLITAILTEEGPLSPGDLAMAMPAAMTEA